MSAPACVTLTTDFGEADGYVGEMKGSLLRVCPRLQWIDLTHAIEPGDIDAAAFFLWMRTRSFDPETVHLVVVDPGVGGVRRALAVQTRRGRFVAPDNGVLDRVLEEDARIVELDPHRVCSGREVSATFHGRDLFAPAAARWAGGADPADLGRPASDPVRRPPTLHRFEEGIRAPILWVDRFGNAITEIVPADLETLGPDPRVEAGDLDDLPWRRTFVDAGPGEALVYWGSAGTLELARRDRALAGADGIGRGTVVTVRRRGGR